VKSNRLKTKLKEKVSDLIKENREWEENSCYIPLEDLVVRERDI
jgi:hypothetical protein